MDLVEVPEIPLVSTHRHGAMVLYYTDSEGQGLDKKQALIPSQWRDDRDTDLHTKSGSMVVV